MLKDIQYNMSEEESNSVSMPMKETRVCMYDWCLEVLKKHVSVA